MTQNESLDHLPIVENPRLISGADKQGLTLTQYRAALEQWAAEEVRTTPAQLRELGRFAVTMSTVVIALAGATLRAGTIAKAPGLIIAALVAAVLSFIPALIVAYPRQIDTKINLFSEFARVRRDNNHLFGAWCALWGASIALTLAAVWVAGHA